MLTDFSPSCEKCGEEVGTHPTKYNVSLPAASAVMPGMTATYVVECDECDEVTGGLLSVNETEYLLHQMCTVVSYFEAPSTPDSIPPNLPPITKLELMKTSMGLTRLNAKRTGQLIDALGDDLT